MPKFVNEPTPDEPEPEQVLVGPLNYDLLREQLAFIRAYRARDDESRASRDGIVALLSHILRAAREPLEAPEPPQEAAEPPAKPSPKAQAIPRVKAAPLDRASMSAKGPLPTTDEDAPVKANPPSDDEPPY